MTDTLRDTLCWDCARAGGGCCWSDGSFRPVPGWFAAPSHIREKDEHGIVMVESYKVLYCPQFVADGEKEAA